MKILHFYKKILIAILLGAIFIVTPIALEPAFADHEDKCAEMGYLPRCTRENDPVERTVESPYLGGNDDACEYQQPGGPDDDAYDCAGGQVCKTNGGLPVCVNLKPNEITDCTCAGRFISCVVRGRRITQFRECPGNATCQLDQEDNDEPKCVTQKKCSCWDKDNGGDESTFIEINDDKFATRIACNLEDTGDKDEIEEKAQECGPNRYCGGENGKATCKKNIQRCKCDSAGNPDKNGYKCKTANDGEIKSHCRDKAACVEGKEFNNHPKHPGVECDTRYACSPEGETCGEKGKAQCCGGMYCANKDGTIAKKGSAGTCKKGLPPAPPPPCAVTSAPGADGTGGGNCESVYTAFGQMSTNPEQFIQRLFAILLSISGGIALLLIMKSGYLIMTANGKPEAIQQGRDQLVASIVGLIFLIFSFVILQAIGVDLLKLPGLK